MGQVEAAVPPVEVAVGREDRLEAGVEQGRMEQGCLAVPLEGLGEPDQPERFPVALPDPFDALEHRAVVEADLAQVLVAAIAGELAGATASQLLRLDRALVGPGRTGMQGRREVERPLPVAVQGMR
ncbi:MAG TPA: hypothetical protein VKW77_08245, partial [Acidimicrobiales bacterium]|nr:hypothetical protein [Acidimicrobiales bacterium]